MGNYLGPCIFFPLAWLESMSTGEAVWELIERAVEFIDLWSEEEWTTILNGDPLGDPSSL